MSGRRTDPRKLTANERLVFDALSAARKPLSAYDLIDKLRKHGITAPPTVYRALSRLVGDRRAHRLESLNAFVTCSHPHDTHATAIFAICDGCGARPRHRSARKHRGGVCAGRLKPGR